MLLAGSSIQIRAGREKGEMTGLDEFKRAYRAGELVFFAGAGASYDSKVPMPSAFLEASADAFFPAAPAFSPYREKVMAGSSIRLSEFEGIQPEVFYEHLLALHPGQEVLGLWKALSPIWLASKGTKLEPNPNHLALARYAEKWGLPLFTTNFDDLFERCEPDANRMDVLLPGTDLERQRALAFARGELSPGRLSLFKVHGSIAVDGKEDIGSLRTVMVSITAANRPVLHALRRLLDRRRLVLLGYSGSDIDFFPALATITAGSPPFWFNPLGDRDRVTKLHASRLEAVVLSDWPLDVLEALEPSTTAWAGAPSVDYEPYFCELREEVRPLLSDAQKLLLLAMCLHNVGYNRDAEDLLRSQARRLDAELPFSNLPLKELSLARVLDCTSKYDESMIVTSIGKRYVHEAVQKKLLDCRAGRVLLTSARYQMAQLYQQAIGPMINLGEPLVDWRPPNKVLLGALIKGLLDGLVLTWSARGLQSTRPPTAHAAATSRAVHAVNDHWVLILGRVVSAAQAAKALRFAVVRSVFILLARILRARAERMGDYFAFAGAQKYLDRLGHSHAQSDSVRTFRLLRDPLNFALSKRDEGVEALQEGSEGGLQKAKAAFEAARDAAHECGSPATELKAMVGLIASGEALAPYDIQDTAARIQGTGYAQYAAFLRERLR